jgi:hypothetical protein
MFEQRPFIYGVAQKDERQRLKHPLLPDFLLHRLHVQSYLRVGGRQPYWFDKSLQVGLYAAAAAFAFLDFRCLRKDPARDKIHGA